MRLSRLARASLYLALGCAGGGAHADEDLPAIHTLPCETACANSTPAVGVTQPLPLWPRQFLESADTYVEGYVRLHFKINTDGHVSDISVVSTVGPKEFEDRTVNTVKDWVYKPATLNGKAVETCHTVVMTFKMPLRPTDTPGARAEIARTYREAVTRVKNEKWDEARAMLADASSKPKLNLYERGMLANLSALIALRNANYLEAHNLSSVALEFTSDELPRDVRQNLLQTRLKSALALGDIVDALESEDRLKAMKSIEPSDPIVKLVDEVRSKTDGMALFGVTAKIPEVSQGESTYFGLYRRNFAFQNIKGSLSGFTLDCKQQSIESKITETAEWHVPKSWSDCRVLVRGTPGTTFVLAQATE